MKIICIGRNYIEHAKELNNPVPKEPVFFLKPDSAILRNGSDFFYPDFSTDIQYELEIVVKINRLGKSIGEQFANRYYDEIGLGIDFTARDLQQKCKEKGLPWEIAKAFDQAALVGDFVAKTDLPDINSIPFELKINGETRQNGNSQEMIFSIDKIIAYVSNFMTLKIGDLIYTGTPAGVGPVKKGDVLEGFLNQVQMLNTTIK